MNTLISWFTRNSVAANLLLVTILLWGLSALGKVIIEGHPRFEMDGVTVQVEFRGATPAEVEESVVVRVEEAIQDIEGIKEIRSDSVEGLGTVTVEVVEGYNPRELADDIKSRVDAITTFPEQSERPLVSIAQRQWEVISVVVAADLPEDELRKIGEWVRDDISSLPGISLAKLTSIRPYEVAIEVSEETLRRFGLTLDTIADSINQSSLDLPAGLVKTAGGEILLRTKGQAYVRADFERIVVRPREDGTHLTLGDIATVVDGFEEEPLSAYYNHKRCVMIEVYRVGNQSVIGIANAIKDYVANNAQTRVPPGVEISYWRDTSKTIKLRIATLMDSAIQGMLLIFVVLALFLHISVALWVCVGIPVAIVGCFAIMPILDVTINYTSVFAFIMVLGLVVDDAIVTAENVYTRLKSKIDPDAITAAIKGTQEVALPVTFGMLTTIVAFYGLMMTAGGPLSRIFNVVPMIVIPVMVFSLIESKFILPAHLKYMRYDISEKSGLWTRFQRSVSNGLEHGIRTHYTPFLRTVLRRRYLSLSIFIGIAIVLVSLIMSGWIGFTFFPRTQSDTARAALTMPVGTPFDITEKHIHHMTTAAEKLQDKYIDPVSGDSVISAIYSTVGSTRGSQTPQSHLGLVIFEIVPPETRTLKVSSTDLAREWRKMIGAIPGAEQMSFVGHIRHGGLPLDIELKGQNFEELEKLSEAIKSYLAGYPGVFDISDNYEAGKEELKLTIKPEAELLGVTLADLARQVRQAFLGREAQRIQRGRDDVRIVVRYPANERRSLENLKNMRIRTPSGDEVPFRDVAQVEIGRSSAAIHRTDRFRTLNVSADVNKKTVQLEVLKRDLKNFLRETLAQHPGVQYALTGEAKEQQESFTSLVSGALLVLVSIYAMLAIPFRSYLQPFIVMSAIPFGIMGAVLGHLLMGMNLTINSLMGMVALTGVVVNDSLVLVDFINRHIREGKDVITAVYTAGSARFRPILLTSLTTFAGLLPVMFEKNVQAQFLIPMAVSLGFGILFATFITLLLVPINYVVLEDMSTVFRKLRHGNKVVASGL